MAPSPYSLSVLKIANVRPEPSPGGEVSLPLTLYDLPFLPAPPLKTIWFYEFPKSSDDYFDIPSLELSLSLALSHYYPYAGHLLFPPDPHPKRLQIHYGEGDSVQCCFAKYSADFNHMTGDLQKEVSLFHPLIPQLPKPRTDNGFLLVPVLAIQVTLFPKSGVSFGFTMDHVVGDFVSLNRFVSLWGRFYIYTQGPPPLQLEVGPFLPSYDRNMLQETVAPSCWQSLKQIKSQGGQLQQPHPDNEMATFLLPLIHIQRLIHKVAGQYPALFQTGAFPSEWDADDLWIYIVSCAYTWCCFVKTRTGHIGEGSGSGSESEEYFFLVVNPRKLTFRENYFGNCGIPLLLTAKTQDLVGEDGWIVASSVFGYAFNHNRLREAGVKAAESWESLNKCYKDAACIPRERLVGDMSSPPFSECDPDFGLGLQMKKREMVSIDGSFNFSLHKSKDHSRGTEIGFSLPGYRLDAFATVFYNGLGKM